jgi:hypothetical protein
MRLNDESYWDLLTVPGVTVIGAVATKSVQPNQSFAEILRSPGVRTQAFWTFERGKGRVFGTTTGHYTYTYHDPHYRLLLMRGLAWALNVDSAPFMPVVFAGITRDDGTVGTTDNMMNYKNRKR